MNPEDYLVTDATFQRPDPFARLPEIAARLGVKPTTGSMSSTYLVTASSSGGEAYDLFDLVAAALDKVDAAMKRLEEIGK